MARGTYDVVKLQSIEDLESKVLGVIVRPEDYQ